MIIFDNETTHLLGVSALPLDQQPRITEIGCIKVHDDSLEEVACYSTFLNPGIPIPEESTKITGITDDMVKDAPVFASIYPMLVDFFHGERVLLAHNLPFDRGVLAGELQRLGKLLHFPWPPEHECTAELTQHLNDGKYLRQEALYELLFEEPANQTHRAEDDCRQLLRIVRRLREDDIL